MKKREHEGREPSIETFLRGEQQPLSDWRWLWEGDHAFPVRSHRGLVGRLIVSGKRLLRGLVRAPQSDLWERQRAYNLVIQEHLERFARQEEGVAERLGVFEERQGRAVDNLGRDLQTIQGELSRDLRLAQEAHADDQAAFQQEVRAVQDDLWKFLESQNKRLQVLEGFHNDGWDEVRDHTAALFARLDQKVDRYRQISRERWNRLGSLLEVARAGGSEELAQSVAEAKYVEFEGLFRGRETEIVERLAPYLEILEGKSEVLDLGCGRGEALRVLADHDITCRGVDSSSEMVDHCRAKGLNAEIGDVFEALASASEGAFGGIVSFHVIEHLPATKLDRLVSLAWRALKPGGVLILETPSPLSLVVGARNFWIDPTHLRPVHPDSLKATFELNGFDPVERLDLQPFPDHEHLPTMDREDLDPLLAPLADRLNEFRDRLDALLFGFQDYAWVGYKPKVPPT